MKNKFSKKRYIPSFAFLFLTLTLTVSCQNNTNRNGPYISPNYLLDGEFATTNGIFDYYDIGDNEYAVSLTAAAKSSHTGSVTILSSYNGHPVTGIWHNAFHNSRASSITIPNSIKTIDFEAFLYCKNITTITIPYSVSEIGDAAFYSCNSLQTVNFVNSNQESTSSATSCYCEDEEEEEQEQQTFTYSTLKEIPSFCFFKCRALTSVTLPSSIEEVCEEAFNGCNSLSSPFYFQNIEIIRSRAFQGCTSLKTVYISKSMFTDNNGQADPTNIGVEPLAFNHCTPTGDDRLRVTFCGSSSDITAWETAHPNWGWYNEKADPASNSFVATHETGGTYFSADWDYTCDDNGDVTITGYKGAVPTAQTGWFISVPDRMPSPAINRVTRIAVTTFSETVRQALRRLYLPKTLVAIENDMFYVGYADKDSNNKGYKNLVIVDDNTACASDIGSDNSVGRINLSGLTELEFIGFHAFVGMGGSSNKGKITEIRLPAKLRAIGDEAFGIFEKRMFPGVTLFTWGYDDTNSRLETVGTDAFYGIGLDGSGQIRGNSTWKAHTASTIIFPRTFKYFATRQADKNRYKTQAVHPFDFGTGTASRAARPAHAFAGCSLLKKVIFKGGSESETTDLVIPLQTFVFNESLQTIIFEERENHWITFHTQQNSGGNYNYAQESVGANAGRGENDFRGEPFLQSLFLPNKTTKLRFQSFALRGNSRATIYLSGTYPNNIYSDKKDYTWTNLSFDTNNTDMTRAEQWKTIGNEKPFTSKESQTYWGYCFASTNTGNHTTDNDITTYSIDQEIPVYSNVHYSETIDINNTPSNNSDDVSVEFGQNNAIEYKEVERCSYVCGKVGDNYVATMTNYLYGIRNNNLTNAEKETAHVVETVTATISGTERTCTVNKIGDSAFSACFCDGKDVSPNQTVGTFSDFKYLELPNTIISIGDYAFIRAYGLEKISSYSGSNAAVEGMPSSLQHIGKNAFLFCNVKQVLKIPNACRFYENYTTYPTGVIDDSDNASSTGAPVEKITSTFSNDLGLRKITFWKNSAEVTSSDYYETTTFTSTTSGTPTYTCALYAKNSNDLTYNKDRLLLVLNREPADSKQVSTDATQVTRNGQVKGIKFDGQYKSNPFLFGAYKMGLWIFDLKCGDATKNAAGTAVLPQPLFSAVGTRTSNRNFVHKYMYLGSTGYGYEGLTCDLDTISGNVITLPQYAFNGCEKLSNVELPISPGATIPDGVFANVESDSTTYFVEGDTPVANTLDLSNSQYAGIGIETFENNPSIQHFIAPIRSVFSIGNRAFKDCANLETVNLSKVTASLTIGEYAFAECSSMTSLNVGSQTGSVTIYGHAFENCSSLTTATFGNISGKLSIKSNAFSNCSNLTTLDFSNVTSELEIQGGAFENCGITTIIWPTSPSCQVKIQNSGAFKNNDSLVSVTLPTTLYGSIGNSTFAECDNLESVTVDGASLSITSIGEKAFQNCPKLDEFEFEKFTSLTSIGNNAFEFAGKLTSTGLIRLPSTVTSIGASCFRQSKITTVYIQSSSLTLGTYAFSSNSYLTAVRFTNESCAWPTYSNGVFNNCPNLGELQLPTGFLLDNTGYSPNNSTYFIQNDQNINIFTYTKYSQDISINEGWIKYESQFQIPTSQIFFYVTAISDLSSTGIISSGAPYTVLDTSIYFWTRDASDQSAIALGTVSSYDGTTVTFSSGHTLDSTGFH